MKGEHSVLRGISSVTFDSPEAVEDPPDQQREPNQSQIDIKSETNFECTEQERLSPNADETDLAEEGDRENEKKPEADILESPQETPDGSDVVAGEQKTSQGSDSKPDDPLERPRSATSTSEPAEAANVRQTCETVTETGLGDREDQHTGDDDAEIMAQSPEQTELKDEAVETTKEPTEEDNPDRSCLVEPNMDSSFT